MSKKKRGEVIDIIKNEYGYDLVFQARAPQFLKAKGAYRRAAKTLGYPADWINKTSKDLFADYSFDDNEDDEEYLGDELEKHILNSVGCPNHDIIELANKFIGVLYANGTHASAVIVFPDDCSNYTAIERQKDDVYATAYDFHTLESMGILKLDILGLNTVDIINDTLNLIDDKISVDELPQDDKKTFDMLCKGNTAGVFQLEGGGFTRLVKSIQPKCFQDLAPLVAVYRPAIISAGLLDTYIKRRTGEETVTYLHPVLEKILAPTYGLMIYQENIIEVSKVVCGYTPGQADMLRRACGRKLPEEMKELKPDFVQRAISNGYDKSFSEKLWELIEFFAGYGFGKGHTFAYGGLSYITAYLKANYPLQFMTVLLNLQNKQKKSIKYITECQCMGIDVLPPSITASKTEWSIEGDNIRMGLGYIKGIGSNIDLSDVSSFDSFARNNNKRITTALAKAGALDCFGNRSDILKQICTGDEKADLQAKQEADRTRLAELEKELSETNPELKKYAKTKQQITNRKVSITKRDKKIAELEKLERQIEKGDNAIGEIEVLGMSFSSLPKIQQGKVAKVFAKDDKKGREMAWITFENDYGTHKGTVFFYKWKQWKKVLQEGAEVKFMINKEGILEDVKAVC